MNQFIKTLIQYSNTGLFIAMFEQKCFCVCKAICMSKKRPVIAYRPLVYYTHSVFI